MVTLREVKDRLFLVGYVVAIVAAMSGWIYAFRMGRAEAHHLADEVSSLFISSAYCRASAFESLT